MAAVLAVYMYPWTAARGLPACDAQRIQEEAQTMALVAQAKKDVLSEAGTVVFLGFREIDAVQIKGIIYERACATTMRLGQDSVEVRFQILKAAGAAGYRLSVVDT